DLPDSDFLAWMGAADVAIDLRHPHRGEVSGSLARAMQFRTPAIVSGAGTDRDPPDDLMVRVSPGRPDPRELATAIERLTADPAFASRMGARARDPGAGQAREG